MKQKEILKTSLNDWLQINDSIQEQADDIAIVGFKL